MLANALNSSLSCKHLSQNGDDAKAIVDNLNESLDFDQSFTENTKQPSELKLPVKTGFTSGTLSDDDCTTDTNSKADIMQHVNISKTVDKEQSLDDPNNTSSKDESICSLSKSKDRSGIYTMKSNIPTQNLSGACYKCIVVSSI